MSNADFVFHSRMKKFQNVGKMPLRRLFSSLKKITEGDGFVRDGKHVQHVCDSSIKILNFIWYFPQQRRSQKIYFVNQATHAHIWTFFSCSLNWNFVIFWGQFLWFLFSFYFRFFFVLLIELEWESQNGNNEEK